jgi:O-antigen ligase
MHISHTGNAASPWLREPIAPPRDDVVAEDRAWDLLLVCVAAYMLTAVGRLPQLFPILQIVRPAILTGMLGILLYVLDRNATRQLSPLLIGPTKFLLAFFVWMVLSVPLALVISNSFDLVVNNFSKTVVMFFVIAGCVRGPRDIERLMLVYLVGATTYAAVVIAEFDLSGATWRLSRLYYYDANDFATFAVTAVPLGVYFLNTNKRFISQLLAAASLTILTVAFVRTGSRGGFVAMAIAAGYLVFRYTAIPLTRRLAAASIVVLVTLGVASSQYWAQMGTILSEVDYNRSDESGRMHIWKRGIGYMLQFPVLGVGPQNFPTAEGTLSSFAGRQQFGVGVRWNAAHNIFVQVGAELGVLGLVLFVGLFVSALRALRRASVYEQEATGGPPAISQALTASLLGFIAGAFFLSLAYSEMLYALLALVVGWHKIAAARAPEQLEAV